jgi:hypothetical protein
MSPEQREREIVDHMAAQVQIVLGKLKTAADDFENATLEPSEAMLLFRIMTEGAGIQFIG